MSPDVGFRAIAGFRMVTADLDRLTEFYQAIGFDINETAPISAAEMAALELDGAGSRRSMALGDSRVELDCFEHAGGHTPTGRLLRTSCSSISHLSPTTPTRHGGARATQVRCLSPVAIR